MTPDDLPQVKYTPTRVLYEQRAADDGRFERALEHVQEDEWKLPPRLKLRRFLFRVTAPFRDRAIAFLRSIGLCRVSPDTPRDGLSTTDQ